jgi:hypothetical protein
MKRCNCGDGGGGDDEDGDEGSEHVHVGTFPLPIPLVPIGNPSKFQSNLDMRHSGEGKATVNRHRIDQL